MPNKKSENFDISKIDQFLNELLNEKRAAAATEDPGSVSGDTEHPVADLDNNTEEAETGSRAEEHEEMIDDTYGDVGVGDSETDDSPETEDRQLQLNLTQSATGEDPETEDNYKGNIEDPGTESPVNTDDVGRKYGSAKFAALRDKFYNIANEILDDIYGGLIVKSASQVQQNIQNKKLMEEAIKTAHGVAVQADEDADAVGQMLVKYQLLKSAMEDAANNPTPKGPDLDALAQMIGDSSSTKTDSSENVAPADAAAAASEDSEATPSDDEVVNELVNALIEAGISPDELANAADQQAAENEAAAETIPDNQAKSAHLKRAYIEQAGALRQWSMYAKMAKQHAVLGKTRLKEASPGTSKRHRRDLIINYIKEICGR
ncbi:MAG: hypothetical protein KatS3mg035_1794 [Bacteroidia bacterium]|nr:MAG: hypothetical protein KatS3mg035_1794 [Bacteroidia bacterium]